MWLNNVTSAESVLQLFADDIIVAYADKFSAGNVARTRFLGKLWDASVGDELRKKKIIKENKKMKLLIFFFRFFFF